MIGTIVLVVLVILAAAAAGWAAFTIHSRAWDAGFERGLNEENGRVAMAREVAYQQGKADTLTLVATTQAKAMEHFFPSVERPERSTVPETVEEERRVVRKIERDPEYDDEQIEKATLNLSEIYRDSGVHVSPEQLRLDAIAHLSGEGV